MQRNPKFGLSLGQSSRKNCTMQSVLHGAFLLTLPLQCSCLMTALCVEKERFQDFYFIYKFPENVFLVLIWCYSSLGSSKEGYFYFNDTLCGRNVRSSNHSDENRYTGFAKPRFSAISGRSSGRTGRRDQLAPRSGSFKGGAPQVRTSSRSPSAFRMGR